MSFGFVSIEKSLQGAGSRWANTYAFEFNKNTYGPVTVVQLQQLIGAAGFTENNTNPLHAGYAGSGGGIIHAIIGFERLLHDSLVTINRIYVSDGTKAAPNLANVAFYSEDVLLSCQNTLSNLEPVPGGLTLVVSKTAGFGERKGRNFYRGCLGQTEVVLGQSEELVKFTTATVQTNVENRLTGAIATSSLYKYFAGGALAVSNDITLCVPRFWTKLQTGDPEDPRVGNIRDVDPVSSMGILGARLRQTDRRKRPPAA